MKSNGNIESDSSGQMIILTGFVIAVIIIGMGSVINSAAISGWQNPSQQSEQTFDYFNNVREEYGIALMISSGKGEINPFNNTLLEFEEKMKTIMGSHGYLINFTRVNDSYSNESKHAAVTILFSDGNKLFNDTVTYNLVTGKMIYDTIPPGDIRDLEAETFSDGCNIDGGVLLTWTAVGDDGYKDETWASTYDVRYNRSSIDTLVKFYNSYKYPFVRRPKVNNSTESYLVENLDTGIWYFAIIVKDEAGNPSNLSEPHDANATASGWRPEIYNISANNETTDYADNRDLDAFENDNITITFQVKDRENDNVTISLMVRNRTFSNGSWNYGDWFEDKNWPMANYSGNILKYDNITEISKSWDYYFNVSDNSCYQNRSEPLGAPDNYYSIEIPDGG